MLIRKGQKVKRLFYGEIDSILQYVVDSSLLILLTFKDKEITKLNTFIEENKFNFDSVKEALTEKLLLYGLSGQQILLKYLYLPNKFFLDYGV